MTNRGGENHRNRKNLDSVRKSLSFVDLTLLSPAGKKEMKQENKTQTPFVLFLSLHVRSKPHIAQEARR